MTLSSKSSTDTALRVAIILLAAGEGSRMGSIPKALLKKGGKTFLENFCIAASQLEPVQLIIVTGFHAPEIETAYDSFKSLYQPSAQIIRNSDPERGQASSVRIGLEALNQEYDVLMVCLCDQPYVGVDEMRLLLDQFKLRSANQEILLPLVNGQRGNPVLFSRKVVTEILATPEMVCRTFMDVHPELIHHLKTENNAFIQDVDTPADILALGVTKS
jgi:CTP:molybdopterin cytidylyltransferase MocA